MISVLREISLNMRHGVIQKADFKIVYVAPMKALAAEVTSNFSKRLEPLGGGDGSTATQALQTGLLFTDNNFLVQTWISYLSLPLSMTHL